MPTQAPTRPQKTVQAGRRSLLNVLAGVLLVLWGAAVVVNAIVVLGFSTTASAGQSAGYVTGGTVGGLLGLVFLLVGWFTTKHGLAQVHREARLYRPAKLVYGLAFVAIGLALLPTLFALIPIVPGLVLLLRAARESRSTD